MSTLTDRTSLAKSASRFVVRTETAGPPDPPPDPVEPYAKAPYQILAAPELKPAEKVVWLALKQWDWQDDKGLPRAWYPSNDDIAAATGLSAGQVDRNLRGLIAKGYLERLDSKENPTHRELVRKTPDPAPKLMRPPRQNWRGRRTKSDAAPAPNLAPTLRSLSLEGVEPPRTPDGGRDLDPSNDNDPDASGPPRPGEGAVEVLPFPPAMTGHLAASARPLPRPDAEAALPAPAAAPPRPSAGAMASIEAAWAGADHPGRGELSAGQRDFLGRLTDHQLERLSAWPPARLARELAPHTCGFDSHVWDISQRAMFGGDPPPPPEPLPATVPDLIAKMRGGPPHWAPAFAGALVQEFGTRKDLELFPAFANLGHAIQSGGIGAEAVADAFDQAMGPKARNKGAVFNHVLKTSYGWGG